MSKTSDPLVKEGLGIVARLMVIAALLSILGTVLQGCTDQCETYYTYTEYQPVSVSMSTVQEMVGMEAPRLLEKPGKIYLRDPYIFISEAGEGVHILDNRDKTNPVFKSFVSIPGSYDMAVMGNVLYTDSYTDLLAFDISNVEDVRQLGRIENVFRNRGNHHYYRTQDNQLVVDFAPVLKEKEYMADCDDDIYYHNDELALMDEVGRQQVSGDVVNHTGKGGSMARFTLQSQHLYALDASNLHVFSLANPAAPDKQHEMHLGWDIETIFPYQDKLFIGSSSGMHILDNKEPSNPVYASSFAHATACDPVVVENDIAYVTLRTGNSCNGNVNQLEVLDVSDIYNPELLTSYPMQNPHGLGIDEGKLFLCEGEFGLKVFDLKDIYQIGQNMLEHKSNIHAYDVIPHEKVLLLIGDDGFYQYDYKDIENIQLLSHIAVEAAGN